MKTIILRLTDTSDSSRMPVSSLSSHELSVDLSELNQREAADLPRDPSVFAIAPSIPIQLIRPLAVADAAGQPPSISWGIEAINAARSPYTGAGVKVAVLDTGVAKGHKAFKSPSLKIEFQNFTSDTDDDWDGHGTHCAGTLFGREFDGCRIGVAPGVSTALIGKVIGRGGGSTDAIVKAMLWAYQNDAEVISMSLGMDFVAYQAQLTKSLPPELATSMALAGYAANVRLFDRISQFMSGRDGVRNGAVLVAAAGNESRRNLDARHRITVAPPAAGEMFLSVAALEQSGAPDKRAYTVAPFSNIGARFSAPGVNILSADRKGGVAAMSGTSMAAPHVAGVAALWAEKLRSDGGRPRANDIIDEITRSSVPLRKLQTSDVGFGLVQAPGNG